MRAIHADLKTAQEALSSTPYIYIYINDTDYSSRLLQLEHHEEAYRERAVIVLDNHDLALNDVNLLGKYFEIGYGYSTASGNRYSLTPGLWVKSQHFVSLAGKLVCILRCEGMWMLLSELRYLVSGEAPYYDSPFGRVNTVYELLASAIELLGTTGEFTLDALGGQDDGIINDFKPLFTVNLPPFENARAIIYRLIMMTRCYLRAEASKQFKVIYPQIADAVDETYYSDQIPYFREYVEKINLLVPNDIKVFWGRNDDGTWDADVIANPGSAEDAASIAAYTRVRHCYLAPNIENVNDANNRAAATLTRFKAEILAGRLVLPYHDCSVELYDRVLINDARGLE